MSRWPKVSVVISNYNGLKLNLLEESLISIFKNDYPNLEVILVDNASTDESVKVARQKFKKLIIVQNPINMYSQGLNLGIQTSTGIYIAFFNNDVVVESGYFQQFVNFLQKNPKIVLSQGKLISYYNHNVIDSAGETMDLYGTPLTIGAGMHVDNFNEIRDVLSVSGSCSMFRVSAVKKIGFFDEDYGIGYEDLDLSLRAWLRGFKVVYYPKVRAFHKRGATDLSPMVRIKVRWHFNKNRIITLLKNYQLEFISKNLPITILIYMFAGFWEILIKRKIQLGITRFTAIIWILIHLPLILIKRKEVQNNVKKTGKKTIIQLLYDKTLLNSFRSFINIK